jgi:16S rRNA (guanine966-N2)-methyltransferase
MRITAGIYKNKLIESYRDKEKQLRPTSSKVREAVFNLLRHGKFQFEDEFVSDDNPSLIDDRVIADLYSGTGIMSFEALSRGAKFAILVERKNETAEIIKKNAEHVGVTDKIQILKADATWLPAISMQPDVIFMDPPYNKGLVKPTLKSLIKSNWVKKGSVVFIEHSKVEDITSDIGFKLFEEKHYNNSALSIMQYQG